MEKGNPEKWIEFGRDDISLDIAIRGVGILEGSDQLWLSDRFGKDEYFKGRRKLNLLEQALATEIFKLRKWISSEPRAQLKPSKADKWIEFPKGAVMPAAIGISEGLKYLFQKKAGIYCNRRDLSALEMALAVEIFKLRERISDQIYLGKGKGIDSVIPDPLKPAASLLIKLGSLAVHIEEYHSPAGHPFDKSAIDTILQDPEVIDWRQKMDARAFLPVKRNK